MFPRFLLQRFTHKILGVTGRHMVQFAEHNVTTFQIKWQGIEIASYQVSGMATAPMGLLFGLFEQLAPQSSPAFEKPAPSSVAMATYTPSASGWRRKCSDSHTLSGSSETETVLMTHLPNLYSSYPAIQQPAHQTRLPDRFAWHVRLNLERRNLRAGNDPPAEKRHGIPPGNLGVPG